MVNVSFIQDCSRIREDGTAPIRMVITDGSKISRIAMSVFVKPQQWKSRIHSVVKHPNENEINTYLTRRFIEAQTIAFELSAKGPVDLQKLRRLIEHEHDENPYTLLTALEEITQDERRRESTRETYLSTLKRVKRYMAEKGSVTPWQEITPEWLERFDIWLSKNGCPAINGRGLHMRNIRAAFNRALKLGHTDYYPFRNFHIRHEETMKRSVPAATIRKLCEAPAKPYLKKYQDTFKLTFLLRGINITDLLQLRKSDIIETEHGRAIVYRRDKTGKMYQILLEKEMEEILARYGSPKSEYLLPFAHGCVNYKNFANRLNRSIRSVVDENGKPVLPQATTYWMRHSWATIASELDIPKETIAAGLGHEIGCETTSIYIAYDQAKVDRANRKIIDYVFGDNAQ